MDKNKLLCHQVLTQIYNDAELLFRELKELSYEVSLNSYNNHYINIDKILVRQDYYMPVITIKNKGDICFNFDTIQFEFYISKDNLINNVNLNKLISEYKSRLNIYEFENCTIDIYQSNDSTQVLLEKLRNNKNDKFGISIDCYNFSNKDIIKHFNKVCLILNI